MPRSSSATRSRRIAIAHQEWCDRRDMDFLEENRPNATHALIFVVAMIVLMGVGITWGLMEFVSLKILSSMAIGFSGSASMCLFVFYYSVSEYPTYYKKRLDDVTLSDTERYVYHEMDKAYSHLRYIGQMFKFASAISGGIAVTSAFHTIASASMVQSLLLGFASSIVNYALFPIMMSFLIQVVILVVVSLMGMLAVCTGMVALR